MNHNPNEFLWSVILIVVVPAVSLYLALFASVDVTLILLIVGVIVSNIYILVVSEIMEKGSYQEARAK